MAELEVVKHTKNVLELAVSDKHAIWHKAREIALEIVIIIFAVTVSIWMHGVSEHRHEQEKVKTFLLGLREDMRADIESLERSVKKIETRTETYAYLLSLDPNQQPDPAQFDKAFSIIAVPTFGVPLPRGRYESFKSSGKLGNIEDEALLKQIVDVYEYAAFAFHVGEQFHENNRVLLKNYIDEGVDAKGPSVRFSLITSAKGKRLLGDMAMTAANDYRAGIKREQNIINAINKLYPDLAK